MRLLLVLALIGLSLAIPAQVSNLDLKEWESFKTTYGKQYNSLEEEEKRKGIFLDALNFIREHNERYRNNKETYEVGINKFADMTREEFSAKYLGYKAVSTPALPEGVEEFKFSGDVEDLPDTVDWRTKGAVTAVKDQGSCGSCWAFSGTGSLEGQHFLKTKKLVSLSEQNLVDCISGDNCENGGLMTDVFTYAKKYGVDTEKSYPYEAVDGTCRFNSSSVGATATGYKKIAWMSESSLQAAVANVGPVSVAIWASNDGFMYYKSGIYKTLFCKRLVQNHGVLAVGYGTESNQAYWLVKNSWGTDWGLSGYIKMARNYYNMCGIASSASYPTV